MTTSEALQKLQHYCAYQERSPFEVKRKLSLIKLPSKYHEEVIATLMEENFLDEYRFAEAFKRKTQSKTLGTEGLVGLQEHRIPRVTIDRILSEVDPTLAKRTHISSRPLVHLKNKRTTHRRYATPWYSFEMIGKAYQRYQMGRTELTNS